MDHTMDQIRILVIDDEVDVCEMLIHFFTSSGYTAKYANDGEAALEKMQSFSPHFVFLDVMMPGMSGMEVLRGIREIDKTAQVVMISGMHDLGVAKEAMKLGAVDYMPKPIQLDVVLEYLQTQSRNMFGNGGAKSPDSLLSNDDWS
ncbi:MAG: response regulator [Calditrichaeota bacterium]|jgi:DNA-binding response OmpR family regulator|nr:response regulator [Calditrichota bacterium]